MAAYLELYGLKNDSDLQDRVAVAVIISAQTISEDASPPTNQAARLAWAAEAMVNPKATAVPMLWAVLAANNDKTTAQILAATDAAIQANVDAAVDLFAGE